jgi:hypothetical protein
MMQSAARLAFDPLISWPWIWGLVIVSFGLWTVYLLLRGRARLLRALALTVLTVALSNPLWIEEQREPLKDIAALVLDRSESMNFRGRSETAEAAFLELKTRIEADETLELRVIETDPAAESSNLYSSLRSALSDAPRDRIAGAVLITDGQIHDSPDTPDELAELGPIHGLVVGGEDEKDRRLEIETAPSFGLLDTPLELRVRVEDPGTRPVPVEISVNGERREPQLATPGEPTTLSIDLDRRGDNLVVLKVTGIEGELTLANNLASAVISGVQDRLRVLLVTGEPYAGARVWRDLLKSDPAVDLVHFTILKPPQKTDITPTEEIALINFPRNQLFREKLSEFDLVIFDHELRSSVLEAQYLDRVARYVENGGALLVVAGPPYPDADLLYNSPLAGVLPGRATGEVVETSFVPQLTDLGRRHSVTAPLVGRDSWGPWMRYMKLDAGKAEPLMKAPDGAPLLLLRRVEKGRVASIMSDQMWLWARGYKGGGPYAELIRRTAHWLMKEPELEEELLELRPGVQDIEAELRTMSDAPPPLSLTGPDGNTKEAPWTLARPGVYTAKIAAEDLGEYTAKAGDLKAVTLRGPAHPREYADLRATARHLQPVAAATLGGVVTLGADGTPELPELRRIGDRGNAAGTGWIGLRNRGAFAVRAVQSTPLLPGAVGMLLAVGLMMLAWRREGR